MRSSIEVWNTYLLIFLFCSLLGACSANTSQDQAPKENANPSNEIQTSAEEKSDPAPVFEEVLPDTGLMNNINPEEIITDDWTSDSPDAESSDE